MKLRGIHYGRVSSRDQLTGASLEQQEAAAREWFRHRGVEPVRFFAERGESARTANRTQLRAAIAFVRAERRAGRPIAVFLVHDLSRFARNLDDHVLLKRELRELGARLDSVMMDLTDTAHSKATQGFIGVANQLESDLKAEKVRDCMLVRTKQGRWLAPAPLGYRNRHADDGSRKWIEPDPDLEPVVREAFEAVASGAPLVEVLAAAVRRGLVGRKSRRPLGMKTFRELLQHPIYVGKVRSLRHGFTVDGQHEPVVDERTFRRVQARLAGKPSPAAPRVRENPDFALRGFVRCAACGRPLTAYWATGRGGKRYGHFHCWAEECRQVRVSAPRLEAAFEADLERRAIPRELFPLLVETLRQHVADRAKEGERLAAAAARRLLDLRTRQERMIEAFVYERAVSREVYNGQMQRLEREIAAAELEPRAGRRQDADLLRLLELAKPMLTGPAAVWRSTPYAAKRSFQGFVYPQGVTYGPEGLRTAETPILFGGFRPSDTEDFRMVARTAAGSNPFSILAEIPEELLTHLEQLAPVVAALA